MAPSMQLHQSEEAGKMTNGSHKNGNIPKIGPRCYSTSTEPSLEAFKALCSQTTPQGLYPNATELNKNIPIYDCNTIDLSDSTQCSSIQDEWYHNLLHGAGTFVLRNFFPTHTAINAANVAFDSIIARERAEALASGKTKGDHFAASSANDRVWNSFSKHCYEDPTSFLSYYSNPMFPLVCEAWLGPAYQMTTQVNIVKPGGKPQVSHRDYHLGFQTAEDVAAWPKAVHEMSALLTLQGAVAHSDMPVESGPTRLLPFSQQFKDGFMAYRREEFNEFFLEQYVSLPLKKGDALFFNPALFHAAGENHTSDVERAANLLQVGSAFGRMMETVDSVPLVERTWEGLTQTYKKQGWSREVQAFVANVAEGYPFPTNLDRRPPAPGGMAPESEQGVLKRGLEGGWSLTKAIEELTAMREASKA